MERLEERFPAALQHFLRFVRPDGHDSGQTEAELFKTQPHLRTVITFLARNVAQVGLKEFERVSDTDRQRVTDDVLINLLKQPNGTMTGYELMQQLVATWLFTITPTGWSHRIPIGRGQVRQLADSADSAMLGAGQA